MKNVLKVLTAMFVLAVSMLCFTCRHGFVAVKEVPSDYCNVDIPATTSFKIYAKSHRNVKIDSFLMCSHEVTQGEWQWVLGNVDKFIKYDTNGKGANYPMYNVSWLDAVTFCNALSEKHRLDKCYTINGNDVTCDFSKNGYRLPTASEWEYASCAGSSEDLPYSGATTASDKDFGIITIAAANCTKFQQRRQTVLAYTICQAMSGNGAGIGLMPTIRKLIIRVELQQVQKKCFVAVGTNATVSA